ncbi:imm11 family protein [Rhizobium sp. ZK1]|uniref:imm11 family protein n=1 Tax=Rhizobium sp. ZK1 TaxID=3389872 RepID=UPI0039F6DE6F
MKQQAIYLLDSSGSYGWDFANYHTMQANGKGVGIHHNAGSWPRDMLNVARGPWQIPDYAETPKLVFDSKRKVKDIYAVEYFYFISDEMKGLLEEVAPNSCEYGLCETEFDSGKPGPRIWQCSVITSYSKAVDIENSEKIRLTAWGGYMISGGANWQFLPAVLNGASLFRLVEFPIAALCDQRFKDLCRRRGIKGADFQQVGFLP